MISMPGGPEVFVILVVALVVLGPQQLPKAMRTIGSVMAEVRKVSNSFQSEMRNAMDAVVDTKATEKPQSGSMAAATPAKASTPTKDKTAEVIDTPDVTEVVANNGSPDPAAVGDAPEAAPEPAAPAASTIDPADRAAG